MAIKVINIDLYSVLYAVMDDCKERDGNCYGCLFASYKNNDYDCLVKRITGTYPDSWKELKE